MNKEEAEKNDAVHVVLDGELTIQRACKLKEILLSQLRAGKTIRVDLTHVSAIDISGMQLLCSAHKAAKSSGGYLRIIPPLSDTIEQTVRIAGFARRHDCRPNCNNPCLWNPGERE
jgi:anti-anti-sigma factor